MIPRPTGRVLLPRSAPRSASTSCPAIASSRTPLGVQTTRFSFTLISLGIPSLMPLVPEHPSSF